MDITEFLAKKVSDLELKNAYRDFSTAEDYESLSKSTNDLLEYINKNIKNNNVKFEGEYGLPNLYSDLTIEAARRFVYPSDNSLTKLMFK
ncbi:hypothetical protein [Paraclostridium bifermentans]|uniref:hypothetical protein n=1 Tax=Paraclostridium bifermentans TaxID=1490 RepID=UPI00374EB469